MCIYDSNYVSLSEKRTSIRNRANSEKTDYIISSWHSGKYN